MSFLSGWWCLKQRKSLSWQPCQWQGDQQGMLHAAVGTIPSPRGSLWPCRALTPQLPISLGCDIMPLRPLSLSPPCPGRCCWHRGAGPCSQWLQLAWEAQFQPCVELFPWLEHTSQTQPCCSVPHREHGWITQSQVLPQALLPVPAMGINPEAVMDGLRSCTM